MTTDDKQNLFASVLGFIILVGIFYVVRIGIQTLQAGFASITQAILTCK